MKVVDPQYLAGVADSDGSFSICKLNSKRKNSSFCARFLLTWTKSPETKKVMDSLVFTYGGNYYEDHTKKSRFKNSKPSYKYYIQGEQLDHLLNDIKDYVLLKKKQVECLILFRSKIHKGSNKSETLMKFHYDLYLRNKSLNSKNTGREVI